MDRGIMLAPVATTERRRPDLVAGQPYYYLPAAEREMGREMLGPVVKTEWPELVGRPYYDAYHAIMADRPDVTITELAPLEDLPYSWPYDFTRVCIRIDNRDLTVYGGDPSYPYPRCG
ncbi:hypothetical protein BDA96_04G026800 [Sorghum bicolor]|uniref:Uncharacterized protein n=2 Tax=Sorghum bicolor TaxID=4558 RepID=A0A921R1D7_SORBI|nr:hypothetical protein BDA96_04G026800 [Sorghum bicolor]OQU84268.1 hypothetical protein SORBI_3004G023733 [Sorghum bicolor]